MKSVVAFLYEVGSLRKIARAHRQTLFTDDISDNIASHSYRVAVIGYFLAKMEKADVGKVVLLCLFHDTGEARSGDINAVNKRYVKVFDDEIIADQLSDLTSDNEPFTLAKEYEARQSLEAKIAKDADLLDQALLVQEYIMAGNQEAKRWFGEKKFASFHLDSSRALYKEIISTSPSSWWSDIWTMQRRK